MADNESNRIAMSQRRSDDDIRMADNESNRQTCNAHVLICLQKDKKHQRHLPGKTTHTTLLPLKLAAGCIASKNQAQRANRGAATYQEALAEHAMVPILIVSLFSVLVSLIRVSLLVSVFGFG
jgi:hypothetical protein